MTTLHITPDGDDTPTLWRDTGHPFGPAALQRKADVHPAAWAMVALVVELGGPERVRAGVELAEASDAYDGAWSWANIARRKAALAGFREVGTR